MAGKQLSHNRFDLLNKIRELTRSIVEDICGGRSPILRIDQFSSYCADGFGDCCCSYNLASRKEILTLQRESQVRRLDLLLRVLVIVQQLLQEKKHCSKRDIYYMHPSAFKEQSAVDRAINDICILLKCSRHNLNVVSVGNGLVMGWVRFSEAGRKFDCIGSPNKTYHIPVQVEDVEVFQRLANDQFCRQNRAIVITGRGYPDIPTRRFLHLLVGTLHLPVYCLVDCDPYGIDILVTYRFGSMQMAYDAKYLRIPEIRWLGAFPSDSENYQLPQQCLLNLTAEDKQKAEAILHRCYMEREVPRWSCCWIEESNSRLKHYQHGRSHSCHKNIYHTRSRGDCIYSLLSNA
ncbi:meiotic recombination protein SPO11-1 isoform X3 [Salvia miltiorrhiza]|uniref:meiotic recombination protein SPO11-1 isoform X3 n=1 Tax=Salvia miltiorrhiza TaxID=226208 RepID=UPI0025ABD205|nr:meiotic recombination protein SPO11-1 isoform X3 [Salvia miltiorrhiza]